MPVPEVITGGKTTNERILDTLKKISNPFERVMIFVDGGYLQKVCENVLGKYSIDFEELAKGIVYKYNSLPDNPFQADLIRVYYFDAIVDGGHPDYSTQKDFFDSIEKVNCYTVILADLIESSNKGFKQKGVDVQMAISALDKTYQNQYDTAIFLMGDRDFLPLIKAVKDVGKKTLIVCYEKNTAVDLMACFDRRVLLEKEDIESWALDK